MPHGAGMYLLQILLQEEAMKWKLILHDPS